MLEKKTIDSTSKNDGGKVHPASREILPDDPLAMHGFEVPGDSRLMLKLLVEEYAHMGWGLEAIVDLARDPNYRAFHKFFQLYGERELRGRIGEILSRCGVIRVSAKETEPAAEQLVQIEPPK